MPFRARHLPIVTLPAIHVDKFQNRIKEYETIFKAELSAKEPTLQLIRRGGFHARKRDECSNSS